MSEPAETGPQDRGASAPDGDAPEPTVGTGSSLGIGCIVIMLLIFLALAAVFFLPYLRR